MNCAGAWYDAKYGSGGMGSAIHVAMANLLRCPPEHEFALAPFAPMLLEGRWYIGATHTPLSFDLDAEILLIDGKTGAMHWLEDEAATGFWGDMAPDGRLNVYSNGITLARDWAAARQNIFDTMARSGIATGALLDAAHMPGLAMVGDPANLSNFSDILAAEVIEIDNPQLRRPLADAMLRAARLPVVVAARQELRVAA